MAIQFMGRATEAVAGASSDLAAIAGGAIGGTPFEIVGTYYLSVSPDFII
ncbi:hypothetical protein [Gluconacetobacter dulcium]|nr:hypothetical protein [Gluconacetobacter dulcium]